MIFTSIIYLLFFPCLLLIFYLIQEKFRWKLLLLVSLFFYLNIQPIYLLLLLGISGITFLFAKLIDSSSSEKSKDLLLKFGISLIISPLFFFKYYSFLNQLVVNLLETIGLSINFPNFNFILPVGISFYTFMAISYLIDVYNEEIRVENNFAIFTLFLSFFPLILSGPIERAGHMIQQFRKIEPVSIKNLSVGFKLILWGYFLKLVVADRTGLYVDAVFNNFELHNGSSLLLASTLFPFQVYADLGGYSLIAIGCSRCLGINVIHNFKRPFCATSLSEFWRRWHISLIKWLTDYIFLPLTFQFRKHRQLGIIIALMLTFFISGLWHGAALTFILWGIIQGVFLSLEVLSSSKRKYLERKYRLINRPWYIIINICITFIIFSGSLIISKMANLDEVIEVFTKIFNEQGTLYIGSASSLLFCFMGISMVLIKDFSEEFYPKIFVFFDNKNSVVRLMSYSIIIILILMIGVFDGGQFLYFQY